MVRRMMYMMHMYGYGYSEWWLWMILHMGLGIAVIVGIGIWITKAMRNNGYVRKDALQTLDERFANGGISEAEYIQKKKIIREK